MAMNRVGGGFEWRPFYEVMTHDWMGIGTGFGGGFRKRDTPRFLASVGTGIFWCLGV
jgi:hypothetical protein